MTDDPTKNTAKRTCFHCAKTVILDTRGMGRDEGLISSPITDATDFRATGNYGSTVWDPEGGAFLHIFICDDCLKANSDRVVVVNPVVHRKYKVKWWDPSK